MEPNLRAQYPLSPRKFWKKIIEKSIICFIVSFALSFIGSMAYQAISNPNLSMLSMVTTAVVIGIILFLTVIGLYSLYVKYYIKTYYYSDDNDFLTIKKGVFAPTEIHVQYLKIQDVYVDQDILDRIMGLYDVHISSATYSSGMEAHIDGLEKTAANSIKDLLLGKIKNSTTPHFNSDNTSMPLASNSPSTESKIQKVQFSKPVSSEVYGLSSDWWMSEIVKLAIGAVTTPLIVAVWMYFRSSKTMVTMDGWRIIFYVWLAVFVLTILYKSINLFLWKIHYKYNFGEEYIYMKVGVLSVSEKNMAYNTIQDVKVNQTFIDRIFGVADLVIENASAGMMVNVGGKQTPVGAGGIVVEGLKLNDAKSIADEIKKVILNKGSSFKGV